MSDRTQHSEQKPTDAATLRKRAEEQARTMEPISLSAQAPEAIEQMLHELRVHQIELEMQNEELRRAQAEIEAGRARYFDLYDLAPVGYCTLSEKGLILEANLTAATLLGMVRGDLIKQPISRFILKEDQDIYYRHRKQLFETVEYQQYELRLVKPDGTLFWAQMTVTAAQGEDGEPVCRCVLSDISERKRAEAQLADNEQRYRTLADSGQALIWTSGTNKQCDYFNQTWLAFTGRSFEQEVGDGWTEGVHPEDFHRCLATYVAAFDRREPFSMEYRLRHCSGAYRWIQDDGTPRFDAQGRFLGYIGHCLDITERKKAEKALRESEDRLRHLVHHLHSGVVVHAPDTQIIIANKQAATILGISIDQMMGKTAIDPAWRLVREDETILPLEEYPVQRVFAERQPISDLVIGIDRPITKDRAWGIVNAYPEFDAQGRLLQAVVTFFDITERKQAEAEREKLQAQLQQAQKMEAIGTLAGGIAHDFNNILGAVIGYAEIAREDSPSGSAISWALDRVLEASNRAARLVKQILAFSRQQDSERVPLDPSIIVKEVVKLLRPSLPSTIAISQRIGSSRTVLADPTQLHQVLMNLATNAFHAMEQTGGSLEIAIDDIDCSEADLTLHPDLVPGPFVQLSVADTGPGIPPEIRDRIFDPYFTTKEVGKGTGMGLAIVNGIVRTSGGFITCASDPGKGAVFTITLPSCDHKSTSQDDAAESVATGRGHILLVDDEKILIEMGQSMLERLGYEVTVYTNSLEALTTFQNDPHRFDVVITDQTMPGMTGLDLARRMLQIRPGLPIILCTGYSNLVNEAQAKTYGIKGFAMKPFTKRDIAVQLRAVLEEG